MRENVDQTGWRLDALELDVARSRVCLAALKIRALGVPSDDQLKAASTLLSYYKRRISSLREPVSISYQLVSDATTRERLQKALTSTSYQGENQISTELAPLEALVSLLSELSENGSLTKPQAEELLTRIHALEPVGTITR